MFEKFASICICKYLVGVVGSHEVVGKVKVKGKGIINLPRIAASTNEVGFHAGPAYWSGTHMGTAGWAET